MRSTTPPTFVLYPKKTLSLPMELPFPLPYRLMLILHVLRRCTPQTSPRILFPVKSSDTEKHLLKQKKNGISIFITLHISTACIISKIFLSSSNHKIIVYWKAQSKTSPASSPPLGAHPALSPELNKFVPNLMKSIDLV